MGCNTIQVDVPVIPEYYIKVTWTDETQTEVDHISCIEDPNNNDQPAIIHPIEFCDGVIGAKPTGYLTIFNFFNKVIRHVDICLNDNKKCVDEIKQIPHRKIRRSRDK